MSDAVRGLKDKALQLTAKASWPAALNAWRKVVEAAPDDLRARQKIAEVLVKAGDISGAVAAYEDVAKRFAQEGLFFKASALCRLILGFEPTHRRTQEFIAGLYSRTTASTLVKPPPPPIDALSAAPPPPPPEAFDDALDFEIIEPPTASGLPSIPLFSMLNADELNEVLSGATELRTFNGGQTILAEGAPGESMFALVEGDASIHRSFGTEMARRVASLQPGDIFGEFALVSRGPRLASVVTDGGATALEFPRAAIEQVIARHPNVGQMLEQFYQERLLANLMRASPMLRELDARTKRELRSQFKPRTYPTGHVIIAEGQPASSVHMLLRGVCAATHQSGTPYPDLREGDLFGEVSVLLDHPATASVTAVGPVLALELSAQAFKSLVLKNPVATLSIKRIAKERLDRTARFDREHGVDTLNDARV